MDPMGCNMTVLSLYTQTHNFWYFFGIQGKLCKSLSTCIHRQFLYLICKCFSCRHWMVFWTSTLYVWYSFAQCLTTFLPLIALWDPLLWVLPFFFPPLFRLVMSLSDQWRGKRQLTGSSDLDIWNHHLFVCFRCIPRGSENQKTTTRIITCLMGGGILFQAKLHWTSLSIITYGLFRSGVGRKPINDTRW